LTIERTRDFKKRLEEQGVKFTDPDREAFRKATEVVYAKLDSRWTPGTYEQVKKVRDN
jgi:TRAP-type C4-dicarboxylate transport system substrate-binding protein